MATDRDRFARVLDKRFGALSYQLQVGAESVVAEICDHIAMRDHEADGDLPAFFRQVHRVLTRQMQPLFAGNDAEVDAIRERARQSHPAMRLAEAFSEAQQYGDDLCVAYAQRQVRWMEGCLEGQRDWPDARVPLRKLKSAVIDELAARHRSRYLEMQPAPRPTPTVRDQSQIVGEPIPVNRP
jgi:hypothetical protein